VAWRVDPHTADAVLHVTAPSFEATCADAAAALTSLLVAAPGAVPATGVRRVTLPPAAPDLLLHGWLRAVLLAFATEGWVGSRFAVTATEAGLDGAIFGVRFDPERHGEGVEVKAVTYHRLEVVPADGGWRAQVLVDV